MKKIALSLSLVLLMSLSFTSCKNEGAKAESNQVKEMQTEFDSIMKETIAIHDEVMPKMIKINEQLTKFDMNSKQIKKEEFTEATSGLKEGSKAMMSWMKKFSGSFKRNEVNSKIKIQDQDSLKMKLKTLKEFKKSAEDMKEKINSSIEYAEEVYSQYIEKGDANKLKATP